MIWIQGASSSRCSAGRWRGRSLVWRRKRARSGVIEFALPQNAAQVPRAAAELVRRRVDILLASGTPSVLPARDAAGHIPVVFVTTFDPVATGLVASLARPGGNITGMTSISGDVIAKRLQLVTELIPNAARIDDSCARSQPVRGPIRPRPRHGVWVSRCKSRRRAM
jgi:ABC transporter substrate binding protein